MLCFSDKNVIDPVKLPDYTTGLFVPKDEQSEEKPVPEELIFASQPKLEDCPDYHESFMYEFHYNTRLMESKYQAVVCLFLPSYIIRNSTARGAK